MRVGIPIADLCAGLFAAQGVLIALWNGLTQERAVDTDIITTSSIIHA